MWILGNTVFSINIFYKIFRKALSVAYVWEVFFKNEINFRSILVIKGAYMIVHGPLNF